MKAFIAVMALIAVILGVIVVFTTGGGSGRQTLTGTLVKGTAELPNDEWFFVNEMPSGDFSMSQLAFDSTDCNAEGMVILCDTTAYVPGDMVAIQGNDESGVLNVDAITFTPDTTTREVTLFYYNADDDVDPDGNITCSPQGIAGVTRTIAESEDPIQKTLSLLMYGVLTEAERSEGITTEFPLPGVDVTGMSLESGTLTLEIEDLNHRTSGGSCRSGILWYQVESTARQFSGVTTVEYTPEELFQP